METEEDRGLAPPGGSLDDLVAACLEAWAEEPDVAARRALERRIAEALREPLTARVRAELARLPRGEGGPSTEDVVHQTVVELPTILASYLEGARRDGARRDGARRGGARDGAAFRSYLMNAARNVARDLVHGPRRDHARLARMADAHPSRLPGLGRVPTTPSQSEMRVEIRALLAAELARLDDVDREIVDRRAEGQGLAEIGRALGMPRETVRDRYNAARARLRRVVERALGGEPFDA